MQRIVETIQKCAHALEGSISQLAMDDKEISLTCTWGSAKAEHEDDAARAVLCALCIRKELGSLDFCCACYVGVATGKAFAGPVGVSATRQEHVIAGEVLEMAARIKSWSRSSESSMGKVYVDRGTMRGASNRMRFRYKALLRGAAVYEPVDPDTELFGESAGRDCNLLARANPLLFGVQGKSLHEEHEAIGWDDARKMAYEDFKNFLVNFERPAVGVIRGPAGSGKTLFARTLAHSLGRNKDLHILTSRLNPLSQQRILNNWRPVLVSATQYMASKEGVNRGQFVERVLSEFNINDKLDVVEDILSIKLPSKSALGSQYQLPTSFASLVNEETVQSLLPFITHLFQMLTKHRTTVVFLDDCTLMDKVTRCAKVGVVDAAVRTPSAG